MNTLFFIIDNVFSFYLMVVILRFWLQWVRADFYNPLSQFTVKLTHPILTPLRKVIPGFGGFDIASLLLAYIVALLKFFTFKMLGVFMVPTPFLLLISLLTMLKQAGVLIFWVLIARALLSWVSQGRSPIDYVLHQLTEPMLTPIRRFIPSLGGIDLSFMILFFLLQGLNLAMIDFIGPWWSQL